MQTIKTEELTGAALDWAVYKSLKGHAPVIIGERVYDDDGWVHLSFNPCAEWAIGGQIIQKEAIGIIPPTSRVHRNGGPHAGWGPSGYWSATTWHAGVNGRRSISLHETEPLIAAMRCYVASKLGEAVEIPDELAQSAAAHKGE